MSLRRMRKVLVRYVLPSSLSERRHLSLSTSQIPVPAAAHLLARN